MGKSREGWKWLNVHMPKEEHDVLLKLAAGRKWRIFLKDIQEAARKAAQINQELREKVAFKDEQIKRLEADLRAAQEG